MKPCYILSLCGISLITNTVQSLGSKLRVFDYANEKRRPAGEVGDEFDRILEDAKKRLLAAPPHDAATLSAELNALVKFYKGNLKRPQDYHLLLCTDTWLGEQAAQLIGEWLKTQGFVNVEVRRQTDLQTQEVNSFQLALSELARYCDQDVSNFYKKGYHIVFNLTGGFKSVQGFLQILATLYADESIYVFESGNSLLRIPRLPIEMRIDEKLVENLTAIRRLTANLPVDPEALQQIPETLLMTIDETVTTSLWFDLIWERSKKKLFSKQLYPSPSTLLQYGQNFESSLRRLPPDRLYLINEKITELARYLETHGNYNPPSLDFKELKGNPCPPSTHECDAWADQDAKRLFGHYEGKTFILDKLGDALH